MTRGDLTLGSLFDGSGGFPLGGLLCGIMPKWVSEIEPFPIRVTTKRLPQVKHLGDVRDVRGNEIDPVDVITFGSPCQDVSIAGGRAGLVGSRSGLFYEAVRIIKEMRGATDGRYPRYAVWENVPGVFSSNGGEDFKAVLEAFCSVRSGKADIPRPARWSGAGEILADECSVAWRVLDAQYWGVPQRRKRIYLIADFDGGSAGKILFESKSLPWHTPQGFRARQNAAGSAEDGTGGAGGLCLMDQGGLRMDLSMDVCGTLRSESHRHSPIVMKTLLFESHPQDGRCTGPRDTAQTVAARFGTGGNSQPLVLGLPAGEKPGSAVYSTSRNDRHTKAESNLAGTLTAGDYKDPPTVTESPRRAIRRLTPTECARLQGFPDWWCSRLAENTPSTADITFWRRVFETYRRAEGSSKPVTDRELVRWLKNPHSDSAEYKMWGNGVALPCVCFVLAGIVSHSRDIGSDLSGFFRNVIETT